MTFYDELEKANNIRDALQIASVRFVQNELDVSATFARVALSTTNDEAKRERARANAKKAYSSALRFSRKLVFSPMDAENFAEKLRQLRSTLQFLGVTDLSS